MLFAEGRVPVQAHAVIGRIETRHDRRMRGQRQGRRRRGLRKKHALPCERVYRRGPRIRVAVRAQVIRPCRVEADQDDVGCCHPLSGPGASQNAPGVVVRASDYDDQQGDDQAGGRDRDRDQPKPCTPNVPDRVFHGSKAARILSLQIERRHCWRTDEHPAWGECSAFRKLVLTNTEKISKQSSRMRC